MDNLCKNHPEKNAISFCHNCGDYYCSDCLSEGNEFYYCNSPACYNKFLEEGGSEKKVDTSKNLKIMPIIISTIAIIIFGVLGRQFGGEIFKSSKSQTEELKQEESDWKYQKISDTRMSLYSPFLFSKTSISIPKEYSNMIQEMKSYKYNSDPISLQISYVVYSNNIIANLDGATEGAVNNLKSLRDITDFSNNISDTKVGNLQGHLINGRFKIQKRQVEYLSVILVYKSMMWQILSTFIPNDGNRTIANKIINSLQIEL